MTLNLEEWQNPYAHKDYYSDSDFSAIDPERSFIRHRIKRLSQWAQRGGRCAELGSGSGETALALM